MTYRKYRHGERKNEQALSSLMRYYSGLFNRDVSREEVIELTGTDKPADQINKGIRDNRKSDK